MFMGWMDDTKNKPTAQKITEAMERYVLRYGHEPTQVLVNPKDAVELQGVEIVTKDYIRPNNFWLGIPEQGA